MGYRRWFYLLCPKTALAFKLMDATNVPRRFIVLPSCHRLLHCSRRPRPRRLLLAASPSRCPWALCHLATLPPLSQHCCFSCVPCVLRVLFPLLADSSALPTPSSVASIALRLRPRLFSTPLLLRAHFSLLPPSTPSSPPVAGSRFLRLQSRHFPACIVTPAPALFYRYPHLSRQT